MAISKLDKEMARKTIKIKNCNYCLSFLTLVWRGELVMCCYNNITKELADMFTSQHLLPGDCEELEILIREYIFGEAAEVI